MRLNYQLRKWIMEKVEQYIKEHTRNCSNEIIIPTQDGCSYTKGYTSWLTIDDARKVADIARQETIKEMYEYISKNLRISYDNNRKNLERARPQRWWQT